MNRKVIGRDVRKTMMGAFMLYAARKVAEGLVMVEIVDYLGSMADEVLLYGHNANVGMYVGIVAALLALVFFVPLLETFAELLMFKQSLPYCERVLKAFLKKPYSELMKMDAGDAEYRVEQDPIDFYCAYSDVFTNTLAVPIVGAFLLFRIKDINVLYILGAFLLAWIRVLLPVFFQKKLGEFDKEKREFTTELRSAEMIFSERTETFVTLGIGMPWIKHMDELFRNYYIKVGRRFGAFKARYTNLKKTVSLVTDLLIIATGAVMVTVGKMNPGHVVLMTGALPIIQLLHESLMELIEKKPVLDNLYARMEDIYSFADSSKGVAVDDIGELVFEDVSYTFDDENTTGKISFDYRNNEKILITGENGAGKTTFLNILLGLLPAYSGNITVNGKKFEEIDLDEWRRHICLVSQDPYIFKDTVRNNILLGESGIDEAVLKEAMDKFELSDFGDRIVTRESLSGGEKQRVSLARAYVRTPKLWIFDEPSNYLDETAKQRLADFINEIRGGVIMILHDRSVIDKIEFDKEVKVVKG